MKMQIYVLFSFEFIAFVQNAPLVRLFCFGRLWLIFVKLKVDFASK